MIGEAIVKSQKGFGYDVFGMNRWEASFTLFNRKYTFQPVIFRGYVYFHSVLFEIKLTSCHVACLTVSRAKRNASKTSMLYIYWNCIPCYYNCEFVSVFLHKSNMGYSYTVCHMNLATIPNTYYVYGNYQIQIVFYVWCVCGKLNLSWMILMRRGTYITWIPISARKLTMFNMKNKSSCYNLETATPLVP